jgi:alkylation response protein AidB-like acyl-CoA dehydrogenase
MANNPLVSDRNVEFLLYEVFDAEGLCRLSAYEEHSRETFDLVLQNARKFAREVLLPSYKPVDEAPAHRVGEGIRVHPALQAIFPKLVEQGMTAATRPTSVGGQQLPHTVATLCALYGMAANLSAVSYLGLTAGAAHLIEAFGSEALKAEMMSRMYSGQWTGTMALTEPQAGSSLTDVKTTATPTEHGHYLLRGNKVFISGGDQDLTENIVHLTLARIDGAPLGIKGVSLFAIPKKRLESGKLVPNDVHCAGAFHKMGWRGIPSIALNLGENGDCHGWLVGEPHRGISYMFQMMNEARLMVGMQAIATASVAYLESLEYARVRPQGRPLTSKNPASPQIPIIEHADVRRMLLRQKAIVEGALSLGVQTARYADVAAHGSTPQERQQAFLLLDMMTPIVKSFSAEKGFESNALAVQIHGGYGYTSEYLPEAWLRDQKLNSIHEGTTCMHSMDLLGRKVLADQGGALRLLQGEIDTAILRASAAGVDPEWCAALKRAAARTGEVTMQLASLGMSGQVDAMMLHSVDYLDLFSTVVVSWQWLLQAAIAREGLAKAAGAGGAASSEFYEGKVCAAEYWIKTELPRVEHLAALCTGGDGSYARMNQAWF